LSCWPRPLLWWRCVYHVLQRQSRWELGHCRPVCMCGSNAADIGWHLMMESIRIDCCFSAVVMTEVPSSRRRWKTLCTKATGWCWRIFHRFDLDSDVMVREDMNASLWHDAGELWCLTTDTIYLTPYRSHLHTSISIQFFFTYIIYIYAYHII
jgi:hypothetical protein